MAQRLVSLPCRAFEVLFKPQLGDDAIPGWARASVSQPEGDADGGADGRTDGLSAAGSDTPPVLEAAEHVLDAVELAVEGPIVGQRQLARGSMGCWGRCHALKARSGTRCCRSRDRRAVRMPAAGPDGSRAAPWWSLCRFSVRSGAMGPALSTTGGMQPGGEAAPGSAGMSRPPLFCSRLAAMRRALKWVASIIGRGSAPPLPGRAGKNAREHAQTASADEAVVGRLGLAVAVRDVLPLRITADHVDDGADHPSVVHAPQPTLHREEGVEAAHLRSGQLRQLRHPAPPDTVEPHQAHPVKGPERSSTPSIFRRLDAQGLMVHSRSSDDDFVDTTITCLRIVLAGGCSVATGRYQAFPIPSASCICGSGESFAS